LGIARETICGLRRRLARWHRGGGEASRGSLLGRGAGSDCGGRFQSTSHPGKWLGWGDWFGPLSPLSRHTERERWPIGGDPTSPDRASAAIVQILLRPFP